MIVIDPASCESTNENRNFVIVEQFTHNFHFEQLYLISSTIQMDMLKSKTRDSNFAQIKAFLSFFLSFFKFLLPDRSCSTINKTKPDKSIFRCV